MAGADLRERPFAVVLRHFDGRTDLHRLRRSPVQVGDGMRWFRRKAAGGMALEDDLRTLRNRRRYAGTVT